jgi:hypothetical protein
VTSTYSFDSVRIEDVRVDETPDGNWSVRSASLVLDVAFGGRTLLGQLLQLVPPRIAESPLDARRSLGSEAQRWYVSLPAGPKGGSSS